MWWALGDAKFTTWDAIVLAADRYIAVLLCNSEKNSWIFKFLVYVYTWNKLMWEVGIEKWLLQYYIFAVYIIAFFIDKSDSTV